MAIGSAEVAFGRDFIKETQALEAIEVKRVWDAVQRFQGDPDHPSLNFHPLHGDPTGRLHTFRASDELRVLVARERSVYVLLESGHHDAIYERAKRSRFIASPSIGFVGLVEPSSAQQHNHDGGSRAAPPQRRGPLDHWTDRELADAGFAPDEITKIRCCSSVDAVLDLDFEDDPILQLIEMIEQTPEEWFAPTLDAAGEAEDRVRTAITQHGALSGISPLLTAEEVERLASAPIEEWMVFLHPDQRVVVDQHFSGPARIRGSAGTGKTVVALHRAAELGQRYGQDDEPVLFTTFIKTLPPVFEQLYNRLPAANPGAVRFINVDKLAFEVCREAGERPELDPRAIDAAFSSAWKSVVTDSSPVKKAGLTRSYLREEVNAVIKGRGIRSLDDYLAIERTGRGTRFGEPLRQQAWLLREAWDLEMSKRGTIDFVDVVHRARDHARRRSAPKFRAAIIDEAQDLSLIGLQMIRALVNGPSGSDRPDGLLIVGDGAQRIYAGGFTLRQAGVEVRGRTTVLRTNYRNTAEIIHAAMAVAGDAAVDDLGDEYKRGEAEAEAVRAGMRPTLLLCEGLADEMDEVAGRIRSLTDCGAAGLGDIAVSVATNAQARAAMAQLQERGVPVIDLGKYDGTPVAQVKVGTHHRVKGLEFKVVFLPGLGSADFPRAQSTGQPDDEYAEVVALAMSQLYVAMTRARDELFLLASGEPSAAIASAESHFEVV